MVDGICPIWGTSAEVLPKLGDSNAYISPRAGGQYKISRTALVVMGHNPLTAQHRARLTTWLVDQRRMGIVCPAVSCDVMESTKDTPPLSIGEKFERFFIYFISITRNFSHAIGISYNIEEGKENYENTLKLCAWVELESIYEVEWFVTLLKQKEYVTQSGLAVYLSAKGCERFEDLNSKNSASNQVFVAQWFGGDAHKEEMDKLFEDGMSKGIADSDLGLKAFRIDQKEHNGKICDEIIAEIRRSKLVIADFTCDIIEHEGQSHPQIRGGVYYEAGFAHGLGIPVIFTCQKDSVGALHFDTRQYNHILWETHAELAEKLKQRIRATFNPN